MKVTLRKWKLKKGDCLYLDIVHSGMRKRENTGIVLTGERNLDAEKMKIAEIIRGRREIELLSDMNGLIAEHKADVTLTQYVEDYGSLAALKSLPRIKGHFGKVKIRAVTPRMIEEYQMSLATGLSKSSVETYMNVLIAVFNKAVKDKILKENPAAGLKRVRADEKPPQSLLREEVDRLSITPIMGEDGFGGEVKRAFLFACETGLRYSDLRALTWGDIRGRQIELTQEKTGGVVYVPLNDRAWLLIAKEEQHRSSGEKVFPLLVSKTDPNSYYVKKWGVAAGIAKLHFHVSRHTFIRSLLDAGVDLATVQNLAGHQKVELTARYGKASDKKKIEAVNRIGKKS